MSRSSMSPERIVGGSLNSSNPFNRPFAAIRNGSSSFPRSTAARSGAGFATPADFSGAACRRGRSSTRSMIWSGGASRTAASPLRSSRSSSPGWGEPALNPSILDVLEELPRTYDAPGLVISLSTVAPASERRRVLQAALGDQEEALRGAIPAPVLDPHDGWALENAARSGQDLGFREDGRIRARVP